MPRERHRNSYSFILSKPGVHVLLREAIGFYGDRTGMALSERIAG
jgi:hypothetical protein